VKEAKPVPEKLGEAECLRLISPGGAGRIAFVGSCDLTVLPVNYQLADGAILFRAAQDGLTEEDLRTGSSTASTGWRSRLTISTRRRGKAGASWSRDLLTISTPRMSRRRPGPRAWSRGPAASAITSSASRPVRVTGRRIRKGA
jgi:nitroimidazol reductase NimA-like FMN-containing flavoprotein (pyridoxamine 5'-phosphate oxidase superfamily)